MPRKPPPPPQGETLLQRSMGQVLHDSMIPYAEHVILERALPRVEDGLKPVQRRILFTMLELGITPDKPHRKSARIVGDCLGKYHPHGEGSVYDAMVRMAQDFNMRARLVDGHGNFGSVDGDSAAAMRYTEARVTSLAMEMLRDLDKDTVDWSLNFDDTLKEPDMLPGRFPNLLVNGATGIAVGLATNIPPHNLGEAVDAVLLRLDKPKASVRDLMAVMPAPDFPTGGELVQNEQIEQAYLTGRGRLTVRACVEIEKAPGGKSLLVIRELPYQVNKAALLEKILKLREEKKAALSAITDIRDESDREGMRAVVELRRDADPKAILAFLYKYSDLQIVFGANMVAIVGGRPMQLALPAMLDGYIAHQKSVVTRRSRYELEQAKSRAHILEGLMRAVDVLDEIIRLIRASKTPAEARRRLTESFGFSEIQAQAILDLRLQRLTGLEILALRKEFEEMMRRIDELQGILSSETKLRAVIRRELTEIRKAYADPRRTRLIQPETAEAAVWQPAPPEAEEACVLRTVGGFLKRLSPKALQAQAYEPQQSGEFPCQILPTATDRRLLLFTDFGNVHCLDVTDVPECRLRDRGTPYAGLLGGLEPGEICVRVLECAGEGELLFVTREGMLRRTRTDEFGARRGRLSAIKLREGDRLLDVLPADRPYLLLMTRAGVALSLRVEEISRQGRVSMGVRGIALGSKDAVLFAGLHSQEGELLLFTDRGYGKRNLLVDHDLQSRGGKGQKTFPFATAKVCGSQVAYAALVTDPSAHVLWHAGGALVAIRSEEIEIESRQSKGKPYFAALPADPLAGGCENLLERG